MANSEPHVTKRQGPRPVDVHVGGQVRKFRILFGMSLEELAATLGLTYQQVQKYERGTNRISASKLWEISRVLGVPVEWFFEGYGEADRAQSANETKRETLQLVRYYSACTPAVREQIAALIRAAAEMTGEDRGT